MAPIRSAAAWLAVLPIALLCHPASTLAEDSALQRDLFSVITLAGRHCGAVVGVIENGASDYSVDCRNGKRFRVYVTGGGLHVADETPAGGKSPGVAGKAPAITPVPARPEDHNAAVTQSLFAIVTLSGYDCDEVTRFERGPQLQYRVACRNGTNYQVSVRSGGRLEVAKVH